MAMINACLTFCLLLRIAASQSPAASIATATTTTETVTELGACNNFVGACVVYGNADTTPYTITVSAGSHSPADDTVSTTTVTLSRTSDTTPDAGSACADFTGACVVYGGAENPSYTTTANNGGSSSDDTQPGNSDGYIAAEKGGDGYIGEAVSVGMGVVVPLITFVLVNIGFVVWL
ncbi:hypothetical protein CERZMDRAFT_89995 [Cercospora zeae-maydis SCOH1-5]|uniref:Uncharacterized protein n=1 Tax=Cercospora zeae-maydis SCOH1-5 TaxID=717836 RepID=A0A6A6FR82_9PEZI|nr:hypothetical protein CERZMDRAFT_89995 [Cercospora zeae-maydis SCOH1-5]